MPDTFWLGLFGLATLIVKEYFDQRKANRLAAKQAELSADLKDNSALTKQTNQTSNAAAVAVVNALDKVDSTVKGQKDTLEVVADAAAFKATVAATAIAKNVAVKAAGDMGELKEAMNGVLEKKIAFAEEAGYARCLKENVVAKLSEHDTRLGHVETKLDLMGDKITTVLDIVGKDRTTVRGESH